MPEPTTAMDLAEDFAAGDVPNIGPDDVAAVLDAYQGLARAVSDQSKRARAAEAALAEVRQWLAEINQVWARRDLAAWEAKDRALADAETRAVAAEAAVQRVRERAEREYVNAINAVLASYRETTDVQRWRGHAEALRQVAVQCCREQGVTVPEYGNDEWRQTHGVYSKELTDRWRANAAAAVDALPEQPNYDWTGVIEDADTDSGSAGQPAYMDGKDGHDAPPHRAESHLPADPAPEGDHYLTIAVESYKDRKLSLRLTCTHPEGAECRLVCAAEECDDNGPLPHLADEDGNHYPVKDSGVCQYLDAIEAADNPHAAFVAYDGLNGPLVTFPVHLYWGTDGAPWWDVPDAIGWAEEQEPANTLSGG